ncbi:MAG: class I SAM-dependent methyltransferase [Chloroflexota bacterium]
MSLTPRDTRQSYDRVAGEYAAQIFDELQHKPFDRAILDRFAAKVRPFGPACDLGCGPGQVARYLYDEGLEVTGVDISPEMVKQAQHLSPQISFRQGTMLSLDMDDASLGGIAAFYSVIHIPCPQLSTVFKEMWRVLRPGGVVLLAFHLGGEDRHLDEWWEQPVSLDFYFFERPQIEHPLTAAGFRLIESEERDPYPEVEHQSRRGYVLAQKPEPKR